MSEVNANTKLNQEQLSIRQWLNLLLLCLTIILIPLAIFFYQKWSNIHRVTFTSSADRIHLVEDVGTKRKSSKSHQFYASRFIHSVSVSTGSSGNFRFLVFSIIMIPVFGIGLVLLLIYRVSLTHYMAVGYNIDQMNHEPTAVGFGAPLSLNELTENRLSSFTGGRGTMTAGITREDQQHINTMVDRGKRYMVDNEPDGGLQARPGKTTPGESESREIGSRPAKDLGNH